METQRCKGARDLLAEDMERFRQVEDAFRNSCINWGYREIKTPTLEYIHLFTAAGTLTPAMLSRVYSFLDWDGWGGERVVLRPDGTIPVARLYSENLTGAKIARLCYVTNVFAFEETGKENREKWQCGVELLGDGNPTSEAEIIALALEVLNTLGISRIALKLSHAGVLKALVAELKLSAEEKANLLDEILEGNWQALSRVNSNKKISATISAIMNLKGKSGSFLLNLMAMPEISGSLKKELEKFAKVAGLLDTLGYRYEIDFTSIKGFEYYTGLCFKIRAGNTRVCSGGRYDNLVSLVGGSNVPACGFALYLDELAARVKPWSRQKAEKTVIVRTETTGTTAIKEAFKLSGALRNAGLIAELDFRGSQLDSRWEVTVQEKKQGYMVKDKTKNLPKKAADVNEVINIIGGFGKVGK
ncbi:MAG: HisS family protein [Chloroflexi bacterium]|nr:HisS family protein [Chloroflexota bacterium]